jgi:hypothetical protein
MANKARIAVALLTLSASGLIAIATQESYTDHAVIPTKGDRPTMGFGSTFKEDGSPVKIGDRTDPVRALHIVQAHISRCEQQFRDSLTGVYLTQGEYDLYLDFACYQYGMGKWRGSSMRRHLLATNDAQTPVWAAEEYRAACDALLLYRRAGGYDCSTTIDGKPNRRCWGVWERQQKRHAKCLAEQSP